MKQKSIWFLPYLIAFSALGIGTFYDLQIAQTMAGKLPYLDMLFERFALFPLELLIVLTFLLRQRVQSHWFHIVGAVIAAIYGAVDVLGYWMEPGMSLYVCCALLSILILVLLYALSRALPQHRITRYAELLTYFTIVLLAAMLVTTVVKQFWGRVRFRDLEAISQYTPWYLPQGLTGNRSFPSGHTTAFTAILCFLNWHDHSFMRASWLRRTLIWALVMLMPLTRMSCKAHYLSDTAMGFLIAYTAYLIVTNIYRRRRLL